MTTNSNVTSLLLKALNLAERKTGTDLKNLSLVAGSLVEAVQKGETQSFIHVFELVEHHIIYGSDEERNLLIVGLLEELKNVASLHDLDYSVFEHWLRPETHVAWRWLEKKWQGKVSLVDAVRKKQDR